MDFTIIYDVWVNKIYFFSLFLVTINTKLNYAQNLIYYPSNPFVPKDTANLNLIMIMIVIIPFAKSFKN
jgi:hypothetical protein